MSQHWLLSPEAVSLSHYEIGEMTEIEAEGWFIRARWPDGKPRCPHCQEPTEICICRRPHRKRMTGASRYRCKTCKQDFSATTGTLFAHHKMSFKMMLHVILSFANDVEGKAALAMRRDVKAAYATHFIFEHKLRSAIWQETAHLRVGPPALGGPGSYVVVDGVFIGGSFRKPNKRDTAIEKALKAEATKKGWWIVAIRQRPRKGSTDKEITIVEVFKHEKDAFKWLESRIIAKTSVHTDAESSWSDLRAVFRRKVVSHKQMFFRKGVSTNSCEWLFSRIRRAARGHYHRILGKYLVRYGQELAWRDDHRRETNGQQVGRLIRLMMETPRSPESFCGYWQLHRRKADKKPLPGLAANPLPEPLLHSPVPAEAFDRAPTP